MWKMKSRVFLILIVLAAFFSIGWVVGSQEKPHTWEYKSIVAYVGNQQLMNQAGMDGWELVAVQSTENSSQVYLYFKRQK
jgi:hypothetical protein